MAEQLEDFFEAERCYMVALEDFDLDEEAAPGLKVRCTELLLGVRRKLGKYEF